MKNYLIVLFLVHAVFSFSQQSLKKVSFSGVLSGKILDSQTKESLPYVNIICYNQQKKIIAGGVTNSKGIFMIKDIPLLKVDVEIQFMGYKTVRKKLIFSIEQKQLKIPIIYLQEEATTLENIVVKTEGEKKVARKVFKIAKEGINDGATAIEILQNLPSVDVDLQSGVVSLRGNENVRVLIDGKPSSLNSQQLLKQIAASSIKDVEIITNPSAKYNPEGMSGIINIVLKKGTKFGFNGTFTAGVKHIDNRNTVSSFLEMNYKTGRSNFFINYNIDSGKYNTISELNRTDINFKQQFNFLDQSTNQYIKTGVDFYLDTNNTLSFFVVKNFTTTDFFAETKVYQQQTLIGHSPNTSVYTYNETILNADFVHDFKKKKQQLELEINFSTSKYPEKDKVLDLIHPTTLRSNYTNDIINDTQMLLINADYSHPLSKGILLDVGTEIRRQKNYNEIERTSILNTLKTTTYQYDRNMYTAYVNYKQESKKIAFQAGLRFEKFEVQGDFETKEGVGNFVKETYNDKIFKSYPSTSLTYYASDKNEFQIGYNCRVDRPSIYQVSPIQEWTSALTKNVGNRNLKPQYTNSFEFNYTRTIKKGYLTFGTFYREIKDKIGRIIYEDPNNSSAQILSYTNYDFSKNYGAEFSGSLKPVKWWKFRPSTSIYVQKSKGIVNAQLKEVTHTLFKIRMSNSIKLSKKMSYYLSAVYRGKSKGVLFTTNSYFTLNTSLKWKILKGKGSIAFRAYDLLNTLELDFTSDEPYPQKGFYKWDSQTFYLGFTYHFGKGKNSERNRKYRENNETQSSGGIL